MNKTLVLSAALVALFSSSAQAQTAQRSYSAQNAQRTAAAQPYQQQQQVRADKKSNIEITPYFGIRGIASFQKSKAMEEGQKVLDENFDNGGFEVAVGTKITDNFRAEFAYAYRGGSSLEKTYFDEDGDLVKEKVEPTVQSYMLNGYVDLPTAAKIRPYLGVGVGFGKAKYENTVTDYDDADASSKFNASKTKFAYSLSAGLTYEATKALSWDLGYRYADFGDFTKEGVKFETKAHEVVFGARFAFK